MKKAKKILTVVLLTSLLFSCERQDNQLGPLSLTFTSDMECKSHDPLKSGVSESKSPCVSYLYQGDSLLTLTHTNALFNCCPESFTVDIKVKGDSLIITEDDVKQGCKCDCLFDLEILVHNLAVGIWHVRFEEPYVTSEMAPLIFDLDLNNKKEGQFCVTRTGYWQ